MASCAVAETNLAVTEAGFWPVRAWFKGNVL